MRASSARGELGGEEDRAHDEQLRHERQRRREKEEARKADRDNDDLGLDGLIPNDEAAPSASGGNPDAECVGEARTPKPKVVRKPHFGPRTKKDTLEDEESTKRERKEYADALVGLEETADWTNFDVRKSLQALRFNSTPEHVKLTLRKLHIRFWHAPAATMKKLLQRAGVPTRIISQVDPIVQTCAECRRWAKPRPQAIASATLADYFNHMVEQDLMFVDEFVIFHLIDRCTRWYHALVVPGKDENSMLMGLTSWCKQHGPMRENSTRTRSQRCCLKSAKHGCIHTA